MKISTQCLNGFVEINDLVISSPDDEYACLVGQVLGINPLGSDAHNEETDNDCDDVYVDFINSDYSIRRKTEISAMFSELYGYRMNFGDCPIDDVIMRPNTLIRITGIETGLLEKLLSSRNDAEIFYRGTLFSFTGKSKHSQMAMDDVIAENSSDNTSFKSKVCACGSDIFFGHQIARHDIIVNGANNYQEDKGIYDAEEPYGPYTCVRCGALYEGLEELG